MSRFEIGDRVVLKRYPASLEDPNRGPPVGARGVTVGYWRNGMPRIKFDSTFVLGGGYQSRHDDWYCDEEALSPEDHEADEKAFCKALSDALWKMPDPVALSRADIGKLAKALMAAGFRAPEKSK